jgi:hypothetical protein
MASKKSYKKPLRRGLPRVFANHHSSIGRRYRGTYEALARRFPGVVADGAVWLREGALIILELERVAQDAAVARDRGQQRRTAALGQQASRLRTQLLAIEERLAGMVVQPPKPSILADLAAERSAS